MFNRKLLVLLALVALQSKSQVQAGVLGQISDFFGLKKQTKKEKLLQRFGIGVEKKSPVEKIFDGINKDANTVAEGLERCAENGEKLLDNGIKVIDKSAQIADSSRAKVSQFWQKIQPSFKVMSENKVVTGVVALVLAVYLGKNIRY